MNHRSLISHRTRALILPSAVVVIALILGARWRTLQNSSASSRLQDRLVQGRVVEEIDSVHTPLVQMNEPTIEKIANGTFNASLDGYPVHNSNGYYQSVSYTRGGAVIRVIEREQDPTTVTWYRTSRAYGVSFAIEYVTYRAADDFYIFGLAGDGSDVIEHWKIEALDGEYKHSFPVSTTPLGAPRGANLTAPVAIVGGTFIAPGARTQGLHPPDSRDELYRGNLFGGVQAAAVDPDGRFLLVVVSSDYSLYEVELADPVVASVVYDVAEIPELEKIGSIGRGLTETQFRAFVLTPAGNKDFFAADVRLPIFDYENDGYLDVYYVLTRQQYDSLFASTFIDNYRDY